MNHYESDQLLDMAQGIWPAMPTKTTTPEAWSQALAHIRYDYARRALLDIARVSDAPPSVAKICAVARHHASVDQLSEQARSTAPAGNGAIRCSRQSCCCTHTDGCAGGWIDTDKGTVRPCPTCKPELVAAASTGAADRRAALAVWREGGRGKARWDGAA